MSFADQTTRPGRGAGEAEPLALIVPVYNEAENFPALVAEVERHLVVPFTMLVVYDFDEDTTVPVARSLAATRPWLRLVKNQFGRGVVGALKTGFATASRGPALVLMADLSDDLRVVPAMLALYRQGFQIVCPSRYVRGGQQLGGPPFKRFLSRAAGLSLRWLVGFPTHDATNNFRLYDAALVNRLGIDSSGGFEVALELTAKAFRRGVRVAEVPATWRDRTAGQSRFRLVKWLPRYLYWYAYALAGRFTRRRRKGPADKAPQARSASEG
jgi:glycosyltransferase involved in cell wall biosynthesis